MGITYRVDSEAGVMFSTWSGDISAEDVAAHWRRVVNDPEVLACRGSLADVRNATPHFSGHELQDLVNSILVPVFKDIPGWKTVIVVQQPVQLGVARQAQVFSETFAESLVFTDEASAREELGV